MKTVNGFRVFTASALALGMFAAFSPVCAQEQQPSAQAMAFAKTVASACLGQWEAQACLAAVSESNMTMLSAYGGALQEAKQDRAAETLKQECAASTAARTETVPAYAMQSAFTACANTISDLAESTGMTPDLAMYQLLVSAVLCMSKDPQCTAVAEGLKRYR